MYCVYICIYSVCLGEIYQLQNKKQKSTSLRIRLATSDRFVESEEKREKEENVAVVAACVAVAVAAVAVVSAALWLCWLIKYAISQKDESLRAHVSQWLQTFGERDPTTIERLSRRNCWSYKDGLGLVGKRTF